MAFKNEAGRKALYAFMAGHQGSVDTCVWYEPLDDHSFRYWQDGAEHTYIKNRTFPFMLGRVIDPVIAFDGLPAARKSREKSHSSSSIPSFLKTAASTSSAPRTAGSMP